MEGNELNVFSHSQSDESEKDDSLSENIVRHNKSGFRHFVEESTLRNISLDELEELSDAGCVSSVDGNIRRTPSSVSSEQAIRTAFILEWNSNYFNKPEGLLRLALLVCSAISLGCITSAGNYEIDVLDTPFSSSVRAHVFVTVFGFLVETMFFFLGVTTLVESFPLYWNIIDAALNGSLCILFIFSSAMLLHAEHHFHHNVSADSNWTKVQISLAAVFGFLCTIICVFIALIRSCASRAPAVPEDIVLTSLRSS
ncbi:uncharacterized protein LOC129224449 [Uloborus diversus]|uniref:uncharacterized protein LOC129224449 n=1 Tax=Uloborus diversus TaxID=327109 RepID=UPI0024093482|nr:uncharacterized protein LOC129224449 [Uloborus diversus]